MTCYSKLRRAFGAASIMALSVASFARAEDPIDFSSFSTPEILELSADLSEILSKRGVVEGGSDPSDAYAVFLAIKAFKLKGAPTAGLSDPSGVRYKVFGLRRTDEGAALATGPLGDLAAPQFDRVLLVVFRRNFEIERAAIVTIEALRAKASAAESTAEPTLAITNELWSVAGVQDVTGKMFFAASNN